ncbi:MAG: hypothetical protein ACRDJM_02135, partial [Actinomycetota bacterium]
MTVLRGRRMATPDSGRPLPRVRVNRASILLALTLALTGVVPGTASAATGPGTTQRRLNALAGRISRLQSALATTQAR